MNPVLIDVHAHLQDEAFKDDRDDVIDRCLKAGLKAIINAGTDLENSRQAVALAEKHSHLWALAGFHPHEARLWDQHSLEGLETLLKHPRVLAVGEIGLDYHYDHSPREVQKEVFAKQWELAATRNLPAIIHIREAFDDFFDVIKSLKTPPRVLLHCFSGNLEQARQSLDQNFEFSIGGALTFKKNEDTRHVFRILPSTHIHLETDCPYLAPDPLRGKRCDPTLLIHTFRKLCQVRQMDPLAVEKQLIENARRFFAPRLTLS